MKALFYTKLTDLILNLLLLLVTGSFYIYNIAEGYPLGLIVYVLLGPYHVISYITHIPFMIQNPLALKRHRIYYLLAVVAYGLFYWSYLSYSCTENNCDMFFSNDYSISDIERSGGYPDSYTPPSFGELLALHLPAILSIWYIWICTQEVIRIGNAKK